VSVDLSIIVPTFNEEKRILGTLLKLRSFILNSSIASEIIVVNDPGTDRTADIVRTFSLSNPEMRITLVETGIRLGKGGAIRVGVEKSKGTVVVFMDADLPTDLSMLSRFYELIQRADFVFGRRLSTELFRKEPLVRRFLSEGFHSLFVAFFGLNYDSQCGVKCAKRTAALEVFQHVTVDRLAFDVDFVVQAHKRGYVILELEIPWYFRSWSSVRIGKTTVFMFLDLLAIWLKNLVVEPSLTEDESEIARFYDGVRGDVRFRAARSLFLPRRIWYARKDGKIVHEVFSRKGAIAKSTEILDVGFGSGNTLEDLLHLGFLRLTAIDVSKASVNFLKNRNKLIDPIRADAHALPLASDSFDAIICSEVIEHLKRPHECLAEFFRILRNSGIVVMTTPAPSLLWSLIEAVWTHVRREQLEIHHTMMSGNRLTYLLKCAGFQVRKNSSLNLGLLTFIVADKDIMNKTL
jgi:dolichyl-phosphate beta-glucosyltransferase